MISSNSRNSLSIKRLIFIFIAIAFIIPPCFTKNTRAFEKTFPFHPGEKLIFQAKWGPILAGETILEVLPITNINGVRSHHLAMITKTNPVIDVFYAIRERSDGYTDIGMTHSILYKKRSEGKHPRDVVVNFNWEKHEACYSSFGEKMKPIAILPGSFDPLSIFFVIRLHDLKEGLEIEIPVTDGKKCLSVTATVVRRENIKLADKMYDTYLVEPDIESIAGVFKKSNDAKVKIWFTADERKIPVKIKSKVGIGIFIFELISGGQ